MAHSEKPGHATRRSAPLDRAQRWHPGVQRGDNPAVALSVDPGHVGIGEDTVLADDGIPHHVRSLAPVGDSAESQVAVVRLRRMEISDWRFGYAEWKSQVACCGYVKWRSPARQPAATGSAVDEPQAATAGPFRKIKILIRNVRVVTPSAPPLQQRASGTPRRCQG